MATKGSGRIQPKAKRPTRAIAMRRLLDQVQRQVREADERGRTYNRTIGAQFREIRQLRSELRVAYEHLKQAEGDRDLLTQTLHLYTRPRTTSPLVSTPTGAEQPQPDRLHLADEADG